MPSFETILAQDAAIDWLRATFAADRVPHGLIFAGPTGVGKATTAAALAALFLCEKPKGTVPCGKCESCRCMAAGTHPDYHVIYRELARVEDEAKVARDVSVNVIRDYLIRPANSKSVMNRGKVFIVQDAELMSIGAQNALLKTLEEPHGRTLLVLVTSQPNLLLATIRSRCQLLKFAALPEKLVRSELLQRGIDAGSAEAAAVVSEGSLGLSLRWLEDGIVAAANEFAARLDRFSPDSAVELADWLKTFGEQYAEKQQARDKRTSKDQATREGLNILFNTAANHLRRKLASTSDPEELERLCQAIEATMTTERYLDSNVTIQLALEQFAAALGGLVAT